MAENTAAAPNAGATANASTAAAPALPALPSTADLLAEVASSAAPKAQGATPVASSAPADPATATAGTSAADPAKAEPKPEGETSRLAALAKEQRRIDAQKRQIDTDRKAFEAERAAFAAEKTATGEGAAKWRAFNDAKTTKGRIAALETLFETGEVTNELYGELTDHVLKTAKVPTEDEKIARKVADEVERTKKAETEAQAKADAARAAEDAKTTESHEVAYVEKVYGAFDAAKFPTIARFAESDVEGLTVSGRDILAYVRGEFKARRPVPSHEAALAHFESVIKAKAEKLGLTGDQQRSGVPKMISSANTNDAPPLAAKDLPSIEDIHRDALRAAGVS